MQENLRAALRARVAEVQSLEAQVKSLEATRDRCANRCCPSVAISVSSDDRRHTQNFSLGVGVAQCRGDARCF
eukprot:scaffold133394_cov22-Tisochrysis_lutea.AAC.2